MITPRRVNWTAGELRVGAGQRSTSRSQHNQDAGGKSGQARDEMHPSEREEVEVHSRAPAGPSGCPIIEYCI